MLTHINAISAAEPSNWCFDSFCKALNEYKSTPIEVDGILNKHPEFYTSVDSDGRTALHRACCLKLINVASQLINKSNVNARDEGNWTPLHIVASNGCEELVNKLVAVDYVDVNIQTNTGGTPLHYAASKGYLNICKKLIKHNADITIQDNNGHTCLTKAVCNNHNRLVKYLLKVGCDLNVTENYTEDNLLHIAINNNNVSLGVIIFKSNPNLTKLPNKEGKCPADLATHRDLVAWKESLDGVYEDDTEDFS